MTKKDYELIAGVIHATAEGNAWDRNTLLELAFNMASNLQLTNPRFNREIFLKACGVN